MKAHTRYSQHIRQLVLFAMFGAMMTISDQLMNALPNVHLIGMFTMVLTLVYRHKALIPIYLFVVLDGLVEGFYLSTWIMYSYIWLVLWIWTMLIPKRTPRKVRAVLYPVVCALHGLAFGILTTPVMLFMHYPQSMWNMASFWKLVLAGLAFDVNHIIGNFFAGLLVLPMSELLYKLERKH